MSERLVRYRHPVLGFTLPAPSEWEQIEDPRPGVSLVAVEPDRGPWFRANAVVTREQLPAGMDLAAWQQHALDFLPGVLQDFILLDVADIVLCGRPARRTLAHHQTDGGAVTMEQWATVDQSIGYTLTTSVGTLEYDDLADMFAAMAEGFDPNPGPSDQERAG